jgi:ABC-type transport system involved in cytochrome bd biosynthesis fused ATPase/permease subunit
MLGIHCSFFNWWYMVHSVPLIPPFSIIIYYSINTLINVLLYKFRIDIQKYILYYGILSILELLFNVEGEKRVKKARSKICLDYEKNNFEKYKKMSHSSREKDNIFNFTTKVTMASNAIELRYSWGLEIFTSILSATITFTYIFLKESQHNILIIFIIMNLLWYFLVINVKLKIQNKLRKEKRKNQEINTNLLNLNLIKFHNSNNYLEKIYSLKTILCEQNNNIQNSLSYIMFLQKLPNQLILLLIPYFAKEEHYVMLFIVFTSINRISRSMTNFFNQWTRMQNDLVNLEDFYKDKDFEEKVYQKKIPENIILDGYFIFNNIHINKGDIIGIFGKTGSGKTTFIKGLLGHEKGITNDTNIPMNHYTDDITYMKQDIRQFIPINTPTLRQLFEDDPDDNRIMYFLEITSLIKWFENILASDFNKPINCKMSGGQKSCLCIALTLYEMERRNTSWLILDEPEQGIDNELVPNILKNIFEKYSNKTIIIITHLCQCNLKYVGITKKLFIEDGICKIK